MPEESINIFISNIYATGIFTGVFLFIFILMFFISRALIYKMKRKAKKQPFEIQGNKFVSFEIKKDTSIHQFLLTTGLIFIIIILFIFLLVLSIYFANGFSIGGSLFLIFTIVFLILVITVYVIKSGIIRK